MRADYLPFSRPCLGEEEIAEVVDTLRSDWITTGPKVKRFEQEFATSVGAATALALSSCTAALHLALISQNIQSGDDVITTPMTFCSGIHVIEQIDARPVLVDVEPDTLNIDPNKVNDAINSRRRRGKSPVKAILPVHLYGHPYEMSSVLQIAQRHGLPVIEDAAHAMPASYQGRPVGSRQASCSVPVMTCFSFYATKTLTCAEGGMLTGPAKDIDEARLWSLHGMSRDAWNRYGAGGSWYYEVIRPGFKYNMTDLQAAIGLQQLRKQAQFRARRAEIASRYDAAFSNLDSLRIPARRADVDHAWHLYVLRLNPNHIRISRDQFIEELAARRISSSVHFIPIHLHPYFRDKYGYKPRDFPVAFQEYQRIISLPLYPGMSDQDVEDVIEAVTCISKNHTPNSSVSMPISFRTEAEIGGEIQAVTNPSANRVVQNMRLGFDVICAAIGLTFLTPLFAVVAMAIKLEDSGPVFYFQTRVGKDFKTFRLVKFRSMAVDSAGLGAGLTAPKDSRVTSVGRWLRRYKLDELPQLVNVLKGQMQLVGPRPELERYVQSFPDQYSELLRDRPGMTDLASLAFRNEEQMFRPGPLEEQYLAKILPEKLQLSLKYSQMRNFSSDLGILFRTVVGLGSPKAN